MPDDIEALYRDLAKQYADLATKYVDLADRYMAVVHGFQFRRGDEDDDEVIYQDVLNS